MFITDDDIRKDGSGIALRIDHYPKFMPLDSLRLADAYRLQIFDLDGLPIYLHVGDLILFRLLHRDLEGALSLQSSSS